ncbi:MAG: UDP-N-acetylmuramate dehydrogenase [Pyrinomonadaceae bacterium]
MEIKEDILLAPLTTLKIGGPARYFVRAETEKDLIEAVAYASANSLPLFILGGGSNILVSDAGFDGLVIQIAIRGIISEPHGFFSVGAGEDWDGFVANVVARGFAGVECLSGIPGFVGGTPVQNVGAYGQEVATTIRSVRCFDRTTGSIVVLEKADCGFSYRRSLFNATERDRYIVLSVEFDLTPNGDPLLVYKDMIEHFQDRKPSLAEAREAVLKIRRAKSMVIDSEDPNSRSAGSFFKNPVVERSVYQGIAAEYDRVPHFDAADKVKIPAAWLIENAGFSKGLRLGNSGISSNHTLALINCGGATAAEILALKNMIQEGVAERFYIDLEPEPIMIGF